jgi:hypothetical protein
MTEEAYYCVAGNDRHWAAAWYMRRSPAGAPEYVCGAEHFKAADKSGWTQVYPADDR